MYKLIVMAPDGDMFINLPSGIPMGIGWKVAVDHHRFLIEDAEYNVTRDVSYFAKTDLSTEDLAAIGFSPYRM